LIFQHPATRTPERRRARWTALSFTEVREEVNKEASDGGKNFPYFPETHP
jgi:hypothetical protein